MSSLPFIHEYTRVNLSVEIRRLLYILAAHVPSHVTAWRFTKKRKIDRKTRP